MENKRPRILVTNDDGINSSGIYELVKYLKKIGDVTVVAPDRQQSAVGHALTVINPLRVMPFHKNHEFFGYAINGTPSDCVKLACTTLMNPAPDLVVSGINHGKNTSLNIIYSGTVSATYEGTLKGIPSIAVSNESYNIGCDCSVAAEYAVIVAEQVLKAGLPNGTLLNVNVPSIEKNQIKGIRITHASDSSWNDKYEKRIDPYGFPYYWFSGEYITHDEDPYSDDNALKDGYVSVTPLHFNFTNFNYLEYLKNTDIFSKL